MAIMSSLKQESTRCPAGDDNPASRFIANSLRVLTTWSGCQVSVESWTITPFEVEFGPMVGRGGLYDRFLLSLPLVSNLDGFIRSGKVYKGIWNHVDVALKTFKTENSITPKIKV